MNPLLPIPAPDAQAIGEYISRLPRRKLKGWQKLWKQNPRNKNKYKNHKK